VLNTDYANVIVHMKGEKLKMNFGQMIEIPRWTTFWLANNSKTRPAQILIFVNI